MPLQRPLHRYTHLPDNTIRLLRLLPHQDETAPIQCQLFNCDLENSRGTRPYEALSYVWGSDHGSQSIAIDNCYLPVGGNLFAALSHLRDPSIERVLWIDAVCINQEDKKEKGHQVQSMAKIYAKATRVIVWLGKATPDIDEALEDIRMAAFAPKQTVNENAILKLLEAAWFRRVWVLQEVAAARHIIVRYGFAEIDGYAFFSGLSALELPYEHHSRLQPLVLSLAYLAKGAAFRSRCTTSKAGRFSLNISHLAQLVDMYRNRQASDNRDKIYALLGMSSDDPGASGLLVDYDIPWAKLLKQLVKFILGNVSVDTWDSKAVAEIRCRGYVLGIVDSVDVDIDRNNKQRLLINWNGPIDSKKYTSYWELEASAELVEEGDAVCLLQGATLPIIIRIRNGYWNIIVIAAASPEHQQDAMCIGNSGLPPHDLLLVWDWDLCLNESQKGNEYEDLMGQLAPKAPQAGLETNCEKIIRFWNSGMKMRETEISKLKGKENLQKAIELLEHALRNMDSSALAGLGHDHRMGHDVEELQGIVDLIVEGIGGSIPLSLAIEAECEVVARLLLDIDTVDPNAHDDRDETPLSKAARKGHEGIVKLLLSTDKTNPDAKGPRRHNTPLLEAVQNGHEAIVKLLINTGKVDVNATSYSWTPLMWAAKNGHTAIVELLLSTSEVEPDFGFETGDRCDTALSLAVRNGHEAIVELLLGVSQVPFGLSYLPFLEFASCELLEMAKELKHEGIIRLLQRAADFQELRKEAEMQRPRTKRVRYYK